MTQDVRIILGIVCFLLLPFASNASQKASIAIQSDQLIERPSRVDLQKDKTVRKRKLIREYRKRKRELKKVDPAFFADRSKTLGILSIAGLFIFFPVGVVLAILALKDAKKAMYMINADSENTYEIAAHEAKIGRLLARITLWGSLLFVSVVIVGFILFPIY